MIKKIKGLNAKEAKMLLDDFMEVYMDKGFGVMNKSEIETLMYHVFKKHGLLTGKCFDDSFKLQIPEAKARKLIYESQVKYAGRNEDELTAYLRSSVGKCLTHAFLSKNGKEIRFVIEDRYLRVALNAKLRANHYFADTSFNKDIISLDENAFREMIFMLVPNFKKDEVLANLNAVELSEETIAKDDAKEIVKDFIKEIVVKGSVKGIMQIGEWIMDNLSSCCIT